MEDTKEKCLVNIARPVHVWTHRHCVNMHRTWLGLSESGSHHWEETWTQDTIPSQEAVSTW